MVDHASKLLEAFQAQDVAGALEAVTVRFVKMWFVPLNCRAMNNRIGGGAASLGTR
jgi:hypothetical protein